MPALACLERWLRLFGVALFCLGVLGGTAVWGFAGSGPLLLFSAECSLLGLMTVLRPQTIGPLALGLAAYGASLVALGVARIENTLALPLSLGLVIASAVIALGCIRASSREALVGVATTGASALAHWAATSGHQGKSLAVTPALAMSAGGAVWFVLRLALRKFSRAPRSVS